MEIHGKKRYATTTYWLQLYSKDERLSELEQTKQDLSSFDLNDIKEGLQIAGNIRGLGTAGASGLLSILFPKHFGTVDQFLVKALRKVDVEPLSETNGTNEKLLSMNPTALTIADAVILTKIMRQKAADLNTTFCAKFWTPRKIDKVLWACR